MARFVLETKATLMNEQENKFKDSEASITSLQVNVFSASVLKLLYFHHLYTFFLKFLKWKGSKLNFKIETKNCFSLLDFLLNF